MAHGHPSIKLQCLSFTHDDDNHLVSVAHVLMTAITPQYPHELVLNKLPACLANAQHLA
jgi:hypothetical protein